mmetsp:Transcript_26648/g.63910  ORF Transcript_26648/g.63910 Transcript_26648/m.63910 type:complete len:2683 (+) Transcript_26648:137-8185(+)
MGKLTGPSTQPAPAPGLMERPGAQNSDNNNNINGEVEGKADAVDSAKSTDPSVKSTGKITNDNVNSRDNSTGSRISFSSLGRSKTSENSNRRSGSKNSEFSSSMIQAVNNAAKTARIVLDKVDAGADDGRSVSSHGSRRSIGSSNSVCSARSVQSYNSHMSRSSKTGSMNGWEDDVEIDEMLSQGDDIGTTDKGSVELQSEEESTILLDRSESSFAAPPPFSPPPGAFQNLPMMRGFTPTHKTIATSPTSASGDSSSKGINNVLLADGKVFEVNNHFDTAAAISAALASSHLEQASGSMGQFESHNHGNSPGGGGYSPSKIRRSSTVDESDAPNMTRPVRRSTSGGAAEEMYALLMNANSEAEKRTQRINDNYRPRRQSGGALEVTRKESGEDPDDPPRRKSTGLPTPEEAEAEMLSNRTSFVSVDDWSLGSDDERIKIMMGTLKGDTKKQPNPIVEDEPAYENDTENNDIGEKGEGKDDVDALESPERTRGTLWNGPPNEKRATDENSNSTAEIAADVASKELKPSDESYENESNTSSVYGSNSNTSDISPISMSTGSGSGKGGGKQNGNNSGNMGMLGNLANSRPTVALGETNHSYEVADDEYSTNSDNSSLRKHLQARRGERNYNNEGKGKTSKTVTICPKSIPIVDGTKPKNKLVIGPNSIVSSIQTDKSNTSSAAQQATRAPFSEKNRPELAEAQSPVDHSGVPPHRASLFDSFDRNWEQAVRRCHIEDDNERVLSLGRKCLAAFAVVFESSFEDAKNDTANNGDAEEKSSHPFRWWVDDDALTDAGGIARQLNSAKEGSGSDVGGGAGTAGEWEESCKIIPIVVARSLWKACFFDKQNDTDSANDADAENILDSIEHILTKDLCYLAPAEKTSSAATVACLQLSLDVYAEYGRHVMRREDMSDQDAAGWHLKLAGMLSQLLMHGKDCDTDNTELTILRRYAAQSLPRHMAMGLLGVDPAGRGGTADNKQHIELRARLFEGLLCNRVFIKARAELLGRGRNRPRRDAVNAMQTENIDGDGANTQISEAIEQIRDEERNLLLPSAVHLRDIGWCASVCIPEDKEVDEPSPSDPRIDSSHHAWVTFSNCVDAMVIWKDELLSIYRSLLYGGKLTIREVAAKEELKVSLSSQPKGEDLALYCADSPNSNDSIGMGESCAKVAKFLLTKEDSWTTKIDGSQIFQEGKGSSSKKKETFASPRPPRRGRRKRGRAERKETMDDATNVAASPLAQILGININDLRTAITVGRSLISLAEFSQHMQDKTITFPKESKESSSTLRSRIRALQCSCLKEAIELLSAAAGTLGLVLSDPLNKLDEDDLDETVDTSALGPTTILRLFAMTREASKPLLSLTGILSADAWSSLGRLAGRSPSVGVKKSPDGSTDADGDAHIMLLALERALLILNSPWSVSLNKPALDLLCESLLSPLTQYKCFLQANVNHAVGVYAYERGDNERAAEYLDRSSRFRRQMLDDLRGQSGEDDGSDDVNSLSKLFNAVVGGMKSNYLVSPASMSKEAFEDVFKYSVAHACVQLPRREGTFAADELELGLSLTLEYSALTQHAGRRYQMALSLFQESLILRTIHVGKHSLDVASLHFNMGVVYDDLEQYDQAISRYHESLRVRLDQMNKAKSPAVISELEDSVLLTLKCMGHVYKIINDIDNAICCYVKSLEMVNKKFQTYRDPVDEWEKMGLRLGLAVPVPTITFDEMRTAGNTNCKTHFQMMNKKELCHVFEPKLGRRRGRSTVSKLKKELTKLHSTVIELVHERKQSAWDNESGSTRSKLPGGLSLLLASLSSTFKTGGDAFEAALMRSSFSLGRMRLEQTRYEEAADHLETALRSKWAMDPASSSDSDSDFSRKSLSSRKQQAKCMDEDNPEEGQIYYALGICNAALDDHERAVRCFLTALRYLRRSLRKVDSFEVARVLFDCATSYYYLCNFEQSVSLYEECLRILNSYDCPSNEKKDEKRPPAKDDVSRNNKFQRGIVLYCLVMARAAIDYDDTASNLLNEAQILLSTCNDKIILAYMEFLTGLFLHHAASQVHIRLRSITRITPTGLSLKDGLSWNEMCEQALSLLEQVKNECWFDPLEGVEDSDEVKHLPLSGHICYKKGQLYELVDSVDQALNSYVDAANFYRIACGDENMYVASVLHRMGMLCSQRTEYHALGYFNEALSIRKNLLGGNAHLVAETLYSSAVVLARLNRYEASMERYHEALRIQMADSQDSNEVARTLAGMGICHYNHSAYDLALTCLEGAVKIRKYRVSRLTGSDEIVELYGEEVALGTDFFNLGNTHLVNGDYSQAMQCIIQSRDLRWRHVGSGTVDKILDKYFSERTVDEDELLGLAHCLHNIGVMFDIKKEYQRSLPHYEEALAIKNAIAGFSERDTMSLVDQANPDDNRDLVLQSLHKDLEFPRINKATLSASVTRQKIAMVYAKQRKYDHALFHFSHALRIQRQVLGKDHFRVGSILSNMGNALRRTSTNSETAIICYNESLRISRLRFGQNHSTVASTMLDIGSLYDSNRNFSKAMHYYQRALSVYKHKYSQELRQRLCSGLERPSSLTNGDEEGTEILTTGDEIIVACDATAPQKKLREQYALVTKALRTAKHQEMTNRGERISCVGDSDDAWLTFEVLLFRLVEMLSTYIVDPAQTFVRDTIDNSRRRIESAATHAVISATDAIDYQFLLLLQE